MQDETMGVEVGDENDGTDSSDVEKENGDADSDDMSEKGEVADDGWDSMPSGSKLGVMGIDIAPGHSAKCWVCNDLGHDKAIARVLKGAPRLWYRHKIGQAEKSTHDGCLANCSFIKVSQHTIQKDHIKHSVSFLSRNVHNDSFGLDLKEVMQRLLDKLQPLASQDIATTVADAKAM